MRHFGAVALLLSHAAASTTVAPTAAPTAEPTLDLDATTAQIDAEAVWKNWLVPASVSHCDDLRDMYDEYQCCDNKDLTAHYIFFKRPDGLCPLGWRSFDFGGETKCAKMHETAVWTKQEALDACVTEGGTLIEPRTLSKNAAIVGLIGDLESPWHFWWAGITQSASSTAPSEGWSFDSDGAAMSASEISWFPGQPTSYTGSSDDGPEDCALYFSKLAHVPHLGIKLYDFHCDPASAVVCATPYYGGCWGGAGYEQAAIEGPAPDSCIKLLPTKAYSVAAAKVACGESNGWLVFPESRMGASKLSKWVYGKDPTVKTIFLNIVQDSDATNSTTGWRLPNGQLFPASDIPWNRPSDPEPTEDLADFIRMHVAAETFSDSPPGGGGLFQDITVRTAHSNTTRHHCRTRPCAEACSACL